MADVIAWQPALRLGMEVGPRLRFSAPQTCQGHRLLLLDDAPAFELSYWCGTCPFLFQRREGALTTLSLAALEERLADGLEGIDRSVLELFAALLPDGFYLPLLLRVRPRLVVPGQADDYFADEQVATWGVNGLWGVPEHPRTPYYRTFETAVDTHSDLYEFVVPMVPPHWNDRERVARHAARLQASSRPTAVAVSSLDVCEPAIDDGRDWSAHWGLTHFLLDGHHKLEAAAAGSRELQLLSLVSCHGSLADAEQLSRLPALRGQPAGRRGARPLRR